MHGKSDISPFGEWWPLSRRERERDACWEGSPMPEERASIPDNWLCISDWQITHQLVFGQREKSEQGERGMWQVHTFHSSWKNTKHYDPMLDVRESRCLYWNTNRLSHNCPHTPTFTEAANRVLLFLTPALLTSVSQGQSEYSSISYTLHVSVKTALFSANYSSLSHYWPLFLSCWVRCGWAYLGLAKINGCYLAWPAGELCITHPVFLKQIFLLHRHLFKSSLYSED